MTKKPICGLLTTAILLGALPVSAFAADALRITNWMMDFRSGRNDCEGDGWEWDADSKTLTLEDFNAVVPEGKMENQAAILLPDESTVSLKGKNNELLTESYHCCGIYGEGELYFSGNGKLKITTESYGASAIYVDHGPLIFEDKVEITVEPEGYVIYVSEAKGKDPIISLQDRAKVIFPTDCTDRNITVTHKSSVKPTDNWMDFSEEIDRDEETVTLVKKVEKTAPKDKKRPETEPDKENPKEEPAKKNEYQITIGSPSILKNGTVAYIADEAPYLSNGYTMLPLRALLKVTEADVDITWDAATKTVSVRTKAADTYTGRDRNDGVFTKGVVLQIGANDMICVANKVPLFTPAETKNGRTFVSLRDWMQILDALDQPASDLTWDTKTKTVQFLK